MKLKVSEDFTKRPGGRYIEDGKWSGELFRDMLLIPKYLEAVKANDILIIDFDDLLGCCSPFLEVAFGGLVRKLKKSDKEILSNIIFVCNDDQTLTDKITEIMAKESKIYGLSKKSK